MKWIVFFLFTLSLLAFLVSGCGWFSDNPMFPRAKIMIVAEPIDSNSSENSTSGSSENSKNNVSVKIDLLPPDVEAYLKSNGIPAVLVSITFSGIDFATHTVSYQGGEFRFNVLENMLSNLSLEFYCSSEGSCASCFSSDAESNVNIACYLDAKSDVGLIRKVEFYINGEPAGIDTSPPFMSNTVSMNPEVPVLGIALVTDINGNVTTISKSVGKAENICSSSNSSSSSNSDVGLVKFTFTPLNKVGVRITQYKLEYKKIDGTPLSLLNSTVNTHIDVIPPDTPMANIASPEASSQNE